MGDLTYDIGGKTGTAQNAGDLNNTSWFVGVDSISNPKYLIVTVVEEGGVRKCCSGTSIKKDNSVFTRRKSDTCRIWRNYRMINRRITILGPEGTNVYVIFQYLIFCVISWFTLFNITNEIGLDIQNVLVRQITFTLLGLTVFFLFTYVSISNIFVTK